MPKSAMLRFNFKWTPLLRHNVQERHSRTCVTVINVEHKTKHAEIV